MLINAFVSLSAQAFVCPPSNPEHAETNDHDDIIVLKPVHGSKPPAFSYTAATFKLSNYRAVMVDRVSLCMLDKCDKTNAGIMKKAAASLEHGIKQKISKVFALKNKAGAATLKVNVTVCGMGGQYPYASDYKKSKINVNDVKPDQWDLSLPDVLMALPALTAEKFAPFVQIYVITEIRDSLSGEFLGENSQLYDANFIIENLQFDHHAKSQDLMHLSNKMVGMLLKNMSLDPLLSR